jgi:hypothetical protein
MLDHHPEIAFLFESDFLVLHVGEQGSWPDLHEYRPWLACDQGFREAGLSIDPSLDYPGLVNDLLLQKRNRDGKSVVGATVHFDFHKLRFIWPKARYIHLIRDGRDVARSCIGMGWSGNVWTAVERWIEAERRWEALAPQLDEDQWIDVHYEKLVRQPEQELTRICEFAGVKYDEAMLHYPRKTTYSAPDAALATQWETKLRPFEVRLVESRIRSMLSARDYEASGYSELNVPPAGRAVLRAHDRAFRAAFRVRRFGPLLVVADAIARRLRMERAQQWVGQRMQAIGERHKK